MAETYRLTLWRKVLNWLMAALLRLGARPNTTYLLTVRGRRTGRARSTPVTLVEEGGRRWLVAPYGVVPRARNARAAGQVTLTRGRRFETIRSEEVAAPAGAPPILKLYAARVPTTRPYFAAPPDAPVEAF